MTNHWIDLANADVVMVMGSNVAENHPVAARWLEAARSKGAVILSVDPRFTRTSAFADHYCKMRSGTDIAFVGGMINYAIEKQRINRQYLIDNTNAAFIVGNDFDFHDGLFSGFDATTFSYDKSTWAFESDESGRPKTDESLGHERCVFQLLKNHFKRYDIRTVCDITGAPEDLYEKICDLFTRSYTNSKSGTWLYAMGATQSSHGAQNIRSYCILQLLLGNIGIAGGGINALRGESNVQGSTDMAILYHLLPGYLKSPALKDVSLDAYLEAYTPETNDPKSANWWQNTPKYMVSLLKAWYGDHATAENGFCYDYLPKRSGNYSYLSLFKDIDQEIVKGLILFGQNPAVSGPNAGRERQVLSKLDWLVAVDLFETETACFWQENPDEAKNIGTEIFLLPAAFFCEKEGSITNSGRWAQWRYEAAPPPGQARPDLWILNALYKAVKVEYENGGVFPEPIINMNWDYVTPGGHNGPDPHRVAREINGYFTKVTEVKGKRFAKGDQVPSFAFLQDDGATACGNWLYAGSYPGSTVSENKMARRDKTEAVNRIGLYPEWAWCWPVNRRILYNRAAVDRFGNPLNPDKWVIKWDEVKQTWRGDVPDGGWAPGEKRPFIMKPGGVAEIFSPLLNDGPFPEHYEPFESPVANRISKTRNNPAVNPLAFTLEHLADRNTGNVERFPVVASTYRMSEHWQSGVITRNTPWLTELVPDSFAEISRELAAELAVKNGDMIMVESARGSVRLRALVTGRFTPFRLRGRTVHQIGLIWHFGFKGLATGATANILTPDIGDPNTMIPEYKAFLCSVSKA